MTPHDFRLALAALAAPFRHPGAFLRSALLPFLICMAFGGFLAVAGVAFPAREGGSGPAYVQVFVFLLFALALISLASFSIAWRRSLGLGPNKREDATLLRIDGRTIAYILGKMHNSQLFAELTRPPRGRLRDTLRIYGLPLLFCITGLGLIIVLIAAAAAFPDLVSFQVGMCGVITLFFTYFIFSPGNWRLRSGIALDISAEELAATPERLVRFFPLGPLVALFLFALVMVLPAQPQIGEPGFLPYFMAWVVALFLVISWFAALETLPFIKSTTPATGLASSGGGHRSLRRPPTTQNV